MRQTMAKDKPDSPISRLRHRLALTQEEFAHAIGVTVSTVNRWENGHIEPSRLARKAITELETTASTSNGFPDVMTLSGSAE
jgi:DNA-binding transcriptional regulator YiaG